MHVGESWEKLKMAGLKHVYENFKIHAMRCVAAHGAGGAAAPGGPGRAGWGPEACLAPRPTTPKLLTLQSNYLAHMKDKSPKYNLSKIYTLTYDSLQEWSPVTLTKMSRQKWLHAITILVTMRATVKIFVFWWERKFGIGCSKPCVKFNSSILLLKAILW